jgi:arylsulfatase A-like enzyme
LIGRTLFAVILLALSLHVPAEAQTRPNILLICADDLGYHDVSFNGRKAWRTPNIDRLARQGTIFRRWYTAGVVCAPSRAALMTGKYGIHNGVSANNQDLPRSQVTIAQALKEQGYATALFGKWHHGATRRGEKDHIHPMDRGFDEFFGFTDAVHAWQKFPKELWDGRQMKPVYGYCDTMFADHAIDYIQRHRSNPFFVYLAFTAPHFNIEAPDAEIAARRNDTGRIYSDKPLAPVYAAMVTQMDKEIGRVMRSLDDLGLTRNTLVVFTSDHGATFEQGNQGSSAYLDSNQPFRGQKRTLWEGGIRVPSAVRWPGQVPACRVSSDVMHMTDVFPTLLAAAGAAPKPVWGVDGKNQLDVWRGGTEPERTLFWEWRSEGGNQLAAMRGSVKLVISGNTLPELYDVEADPAERRNRIAEFPIVSRDLRAALLGWLTTETQESKEGTPRGR